MIVPAVTEVCRPQRAHSHVHGLVCSSHALLVPQPGQTKPCGQRAAKRYWAHAASSEKRCWNSINERGKSLTVASRDRLCSLFVLHHTRSLYHHLSRYRKQRHKPPAEIACARASGPSRYCV